MRSSGPGFTLLETVLAIMLGSLVLAAALSLFAVMQRAQESAFARADANVEIARVHRTMQRTFSSLLMVEAPPSTPASSTTAATDSDSQQEPADSNSNSLPTDAPPPLPRLSLSFDPRFPNRDIQRLEVVLSAPPIPADPVHSEANAWADAALELETIEDDSPGLRGVFVLAPADPDPDLVRSNMSSESGWTLWWIPRDGERVRVATGLAQLNWIVARSENNVVEKLREYTASATDELPNFVEVELTTVKGQRSSMMFEIAWTVGEEPDTSTSDEIPSGESPDEISQPGGGAAVPMLDALPISSGRPRGGQRPRPAGEEG